jgi:hypothetical protein
LKDLQQMQILSIDVGLLHLALLKVCLADDYLERSEVILEKEITLCDLVNITELISNCKDTNCELYHDKIICDYMTHLFKNFKSDFDSAELILIERQPPTGIVAVEQLIMREYRSKCKLISPTAMLNFFGLLHYKYLERKVYTEQIAMEYLSSIKVFVFNERRHDMADAFCILYYYLSLKKKEHQVYLKELEHKEKYKTFIGNRQQFRYIPDQ